MIKKHVQLRIHDLLDAGIPVTQIVEMTGVSIATIYKYKRLGRQLQGQTSRTIDKRMTELEPYHEIIDTCVKRQKMKLKTVIFAVQKAGYTGPNSAVERYYRQRKQELQPERHMQHIETGPGKQAQVDWGHFGEMTINGKREKVYLFAYILGYSRMAYLEFVVRQNQRTLQACHIRAFEKLGIPEEVVYDNMKTVVSHRTRASYEDEEDVVQYNAAFIDFAKYYRFRVWACPPYWPRTKGKVENTIQYVRKYFPRVTPKQRITLEELNDRLSSWLANHAHKRDHGTTHQKPSERWLEEKPYLRFPTNIPPYNPAPLRTYHTTQYGLLVRNRVTYNLGPNFARMKLEIREVQHHGLPFLEIYRHNRLAMTLQVPTKIGSWVSIDEPPSPPKPEKALKQQKTVIKPIKPAYDIEVEQRDLSYYGMAGAE